MIDIVIPLGNGSTWYDNELRWCLRSIHTYVRETRNVVIVGELPVFLRDVIHIPFKDGPTKEKNIMLKIMAACNDARVSDNFFFANDDYFFIEQVSGKRFPSYYNCRLDEVIRGRRFRDRYQVALENTNAALKNKMFDTLHFDIHVPIIYNKKKFREAMGQYNWEILHGYVVKSLYANTAKVKGTQMHDCKIDSHMLWAEIREKIQGRFMFSHGPRGLSYDIKKLMQEHCPGPSPWESV